MIKAKLSISQVKDTIEKLKNKNVQVTFSLGRNKYITFSARLEGVYAALFRVKAKDEKFRGKTSYSYNEYMCGKVKLKEIAE